MKSHPDELRLLDSPKEDLHSVRKVGIMLYPIGLSKWKLFKPHGKNTKTQASVGWICEELKTLCSTENKPIPVIGPNWFYTLTHTLHEPEPEGLAGQSLVQVSLSKTLNLNFSPVFEQMSQLLYKIEKPCPADYSRVNVCGSFELLY